MGFCTLSIFVSFLLLEECQLFLFHMLLWGFSSFCGCSGQTFKFADHHTLKSLGFTVKSKFMPAHATSHKHNSQGQHTLQDCILQIADSSTVTMWFSSLMKGFSSQSLTRALKSLPVYPPSYSTVASVRPQERLLTKHGLSILPQLLGCSDIHLSWDQEAPENYLRAWRGKRDIGSFHNE